MRRQALPYIYASLLLGAWAVASWAAGPFTSGTDEIDMTSINSGGSSKPTYSAAGEPTLDLTGSVGEIGVSTFEGTNETIEAGLMNALPPPAPPPDADGDGVPDSADACDNATAPAGLMSYWGFEDGSGTAASDSFDGNPGTVVGATWTTGKVGGALSFDGADDYVNTAPDIFSKSDFSNGATLEAWVYPTATPANAATVLGIEGRFTINEDFDHANKWSATLYDGANHGATADGTISVNQWAHLVAVWDTTRVILYVDGVQQADVPAVANFASIDVVSRPLDIGAFGGGPSQFFNGLIDEAAIYNRALTPAEIAEHYSAGQGKSYCEPPAPDADGDGIPDDADACDDNDAPAGLVSYWGFEEGSGDTAQDSYDAHPG
ncbi:MAG: LamG domain-containing protein, partial [Elusimicrobiota bacterium]